MQAISRLRGDAFADRMMRRISFNIARMLHAAEHAGKPRPRAP
jgi:hypothetical protein